MSHAEALRRSAETMRQYADRMERRADEAEAAERIARRPAEPTIRPGHTEVLVFKSGNAVLPNHVAVGELVDGAQRWAIIAHPATILLTWVEFLNAIGESNWESLRVVVETGPLQRPDQGETK